MESFLDKINKAYKKGIENPRFQEAISEIIKEPEKDESKEILVDESKVLSETKGRDSQREER